MASRPVFIPRESGKVFVETSFVDFQWHPGMAASQKQKSISSLHDSAKRELGLKRILEVSSKSIDPIGVSLSAFNLTIETVKLQRKFSVECAYQGSKVFENGGPYVDLLDKSSLEAKKDPRITASGKLTGFSFFGVTWELEPITAFYDWLYINALRKRSDLVNELLNFDGFTDIEFNPERSINCQAYSVSLCISLFKRGLLSDGIASKKLFIETIADSLINNSQENQLIQNGLDFG